MNNHSMNPDDGGRIMAEVWKGATSDCNLLAGIMQDDCAIWQDEGQCNVVSQDFINVRPALLDLGVGGSYEIGRLSVKATISDLAASGAIPRYLLCGCRIPNSYSIIDFQQLAQGIFDEANLYGTRLVGGDTKQGLDFSLIITGFGTVRNPSELMAMENAQPGDDLWVSGPLGSFAAAVYGYPTLKQDPDLKTWADKVICGNEVPLAQARSVACLRLNCGATDITDGFSRDLRNFCQVAGTGACIELEDIPVEQNLIKIAHLSGKSTWQFALASGGDFQFMAAARPEHAAIFKENQFKKVGVLTENKNVKFTYQGIEISIDPDLGHADLRNQSFSEEIAYCLSK